MIKARRKSRRNHIMDEQLVGSLEIKTTMFHNVSVEGQKSIIFMKQSEVMRNLINSWRS